MAIEWKVVATKLLPEQYRELKTIAKQHNTTVYALVKNAVIDAYNIPPVRFPHYTTRRKGQDERVKPRPCARVFRRSRRAGR